MIEKIREEIYVPIMLKTTDALGILSLFNWHQDNSQLY